MAKTALRPRLSQKQIRFIREYAIHGNGTEAARKAGYNQNANGLGVQAHDNLRKPKIVSALKQELAKIDVDITPKRVQRRLDEISRESQGAGQFGPAVRAEELLGKSIGMWVDQSIQLTGALSDSHVAALLDIARRRRAEPIDLEDEGRGHNQGHSKDRDE